jgi:hypothetical protein
MHASLRSPSRLLLAALALGLAADLLFHGRALGISAPLFVALGLGLLLWRSRAEGRPPTSANLWLGGAALLFALLIAVRADLFLTALNLCACAGLLFLQAIGFRSEPLARLPAWRTGVRAMVASVELAFLPAPLVAEGASRLLASSDRARSLAPVGRGLVLAAPVLVTFTLLLVAADSVFASYISAVLSLELPFDAASALGHGLFVGAVSWVCAGGMLVALRGAGAAPEELPSEGETRRLSAPSVPWRPLGAVEALTVLLTVCGLFGAFMLIQAAYLFGGLDTLARTGMTYSEYARRGFFELLAVAFLALCLLWLLALLTRRDTRRTRNAFNTACVLLTTLVLGLLASAFQRMMLYQAAYGFTHLRLYTLSFMVWLALVLLLFVAALLGDRPRLFTIGTFVSALVYLAALNLANPDALIVRENVARYQASGKLDSWHLTTLSADGAPALVAALPALGAEERAVVEEALATQLAEIEEIEAGSGWPAWHLGRALARGAIETGRR